MNAKKLLAIAAVLVMAGGLARADETYWNSRMTYDPAGPDAFKGNQLSADLFGTWADRDRFGGSNRRWGGGAGLDYFITRYLGVGADTYMEEWRWPYRVNGSAIVRLPFQHRGVGFAIYGFGGGGREFKYTPQYTGHAGGGVEFKFNRYTGLFADYRRVFPDKTADYDLIRAGVRLGF